MSNTEENTNVAAKQPDAPPAKEEAPVAASPSPPLPPIVPPLQIPAPADPKPSLHPPVKRKEDKRARGKRPSTAQADTYQLRNAFNQAVAKLSGKDTMKVGMQEARSLVEKNVSPKALRIFLSSLSDTERGTNPSGKEAQVQLLGFVAEKFSLALLDPLDTPPSLLKSAARLCSIVHRYLKVSSSCLKRNHRKTLRRCILHVGRL